MKIAVNTRLLLHNKLEGIGVFTYETLKRLACWYPQHEFYFLFDRPFHPDFIFGSNITPIVIGPQARHPFLFYYWFEVMVARTLRKIKPDVFLSTDGFLALTNNTITVSVIHDLNFEHYPQVIPSWLIRHYYKYFFPRFARKATRIATVSEFSKQDIVRCYTISADKIDVCYNGASTDYKPLNTQQIQAIRKKYVDKCPYFAYVGSLNPRKNIANLLLAYDKFRDAYPEKIKLVLVGEKMWWTDEMEQTYQSLQHKNDVVFTGRLSEEDLQQVMAAALALTYVPFFEGFGIPIVEAFYSGVPVITSNITAMPEVAADAAILVNPFSVAEITKAMQQITSDEDLRNSLIAKGFVRARIFTWDETARALWNCIIKAVERV